jgi:hypothetical protein
VLLCGAQVAAQHVLDALQDGVLVGVVRVLLAGDLEDGRHRLRAARSAQSQATKHSMEVSAGKKAINVMFSRHLDVAARSRQVTRRNMFRGTYRLACHGQYQSHAVARRHSGRAAGALRARPARGRAPCCSC